MTKLLASAISLVVLFGSVNAVKAQTSNERAFQEFRRSFTIGMRNEDNARKKIKEFNLNLAKSSLLLSHYRLIVNDDEVVTRIFEEIRASGHLDRALRAPNSIDQQLPEVASLGYELFESLAVKGLRRLEYTDVRAYMQFLGKTFESVPVNVCKAMLVGDINGQKDESALMVSLMARLPDSEIEAYLRLVRKSIFSEVRNFPSIKSITDAQRRHAETAFEQMLMKNLREHPRSQRLFFAASDLRAANDTEACQLGQLSIKSMLDMKGAVSEWQARIFVESLQ